MNEEKPFRKVFSKNCFGVANCGEFLYQKLYKFKKFLSNVICSLTLTAITD